MSAALGFLRGELCRLPKRLCRLLPLLLLLAAASLAALAAVSAGAWQKESVLRLALVDKQRATPRRFPRKSGEAGRNPILSE